MVEVLLLGRRSSLGISAACRAILTAKCLPAKGESRDAIEADIASRQWLSDVGL